MSGGSENGINGRKDNMMAVTDQNYKNWIQDISGRFRRSQIKAATHVNEEMLKFYWSLGHDISSMENAYGSGLFKNLSHDLKKELPGVKSFSVTNLHYMVWFYELYPNALNLPQAGVDSDNCNNYLPQNGADSVKVIFRIPWGHNKLIIDKCKRDEKKALFYVKESLSNNWSRATLLNFLDTNLYERHGKAISNFKLSLPAEKSDLAQEITRDPYDFDFLTLRSDYDEKELKDALMDNLQNFFLELGKGFALMGREYRLVIGRTEQFLDMLFYNVQLHCYVVVEIKVRDFEPGDMGQLTTYVAAVDDMLRSDMDGQTIGLLICKTKDNVLAQYAADGLKYPVGISEYKLCDILPENYKSSMPTIQEIEEELNDDRK